MTTDLKWLQGQITENPREARKDLDRLAVGFLQALVEEQVSEPESASKDSSEPAQSGAV